MKACAHSKTDRHTAKKAATKLATAAAPPGSGKKLVFGVIGDPVEHSLSPVMHNAAFAALGMKAEYRRFAVKTDRLKDFLKGLRSGKIAGVNVTIPHKEAVVPLVDTLSPEASRLGAVNTVLVEKGRLIGHNTDGAGFVHSLYEQRHADVSKLRTTVLGAGGAGVAIAHALCQNRVKAIAILNRDPGRAEALAKTLKKNYPRVPVNLGRLDQPDPRIFRNTDLLINATALGMKDNPWPGFEFLAWLPREATVADIVYNPMETELLARANALGLAAHPGYGMLLYQGVLAFGLFTGLKAPVAAMEKALLKSLETAGG